MKIKPAVTEGTPEPVLEALNSKHIARRIYTEVLQGPLRVKSMGPAEWYIQRADETIEVEEGSFGCEVRLTGVSRNPKRSEQDFWDAREVLERIYRETIEENLPVGMKMQLFVAIMLDAPIRDERGRDTTIVEGDAVWVEGKKSHVRRSGILPVVAPGPYAPPRGAKRPPH